MTSSLAISQLPRVASAIYFWPLEKVRPYDRNPKSHPDEQVSELAAGLVEHGFLKPLIVDEDGELLAGHGLLLAARRLKLENVPVIIHIGLSPEQKRAYRIADNRLAEKSEWDDDALAGELAALKEAGHELLLTGFTDEEVKDLIDGLEEEDKGEEAGAGATKRLSYTILFDDEEQHSTWMAFIEQLNERPGLEKYTVAGRLAAHAGEVLEER